MTADQNTRPCEATTLIEGVRLAISFGAATGSLQAVDLHKLLWRLRSLGRLKQTLLTPKDKSHARPFTLSSLHGKERFPFHTDGALEVRPPRLIILINASDQRFISPTVVSPIALLPSDYQRDLRASRWLCKFGSAKVPLFGFFTAAQGSGYRFDLDALSPGCRFAEKCANDIIPLLAERAAPVCWQPWSYVVIDNWNVTHGRSAVSEAEISVRRIERWEFWPYAGMDFGSLLV